MHFEGGFSTRKCIENSIEFAHWRDKGLTLICSLSKCFGIIGSIQYKALAAFFFLFIPFAFLSPLPQLGVRRVDSFFSYTVLGVSTYSICKIRVWWEVEFQHKALKIEKKNQNIVLAEENNSNYDKFKKNWLCWPHLKHKHSHWLMQAKLTILSALITAWLKLSPIQTIGVGWGYCVVSTLLSGPVKMTLISRRCFKIGSSCS